MSTYSNRQIPVNLGVQSKHGKIRKTKTPYLDLYLRSDKHDLMQIGKELK